MIDETILTDDQDDYLRQIREIDMSRVQRNSPNYGLVRELENFGFVDIGCVGDSEGFLVALTPSGREYLNLIGGQDDRARA
tara:strand:+ start:407 stop:649 length:243 start_codon:yes stop_codon:yes gene_type:complete